MKCPKCGYNSFEYLDSCKKCNADLAGFKASHGIRPTILPAKELVTGGVAGAPAHDVTPVPAAASIQESEEFSWQESTEEPAAGAGALPSLGLDQPPPEPDHFNFSLDLPSADAESAAESAPEEFPFDGFGNDGNDFLIENEPPANPQTAEDEPAAQTETPFGELSFEDIYSAKEEEPAPVAATAAEEAAMPDFFAPAEAEAPMEAASENAFDGLFELERTAVEEAPGFPQEEAESSGPEQFLTDESLPTDAAADDDADLMGLSPEEYESLFGEAPKKKSTASKPAEG